MSKQVHNNICIFCGKNAENQTDEHIISQWLIRAFGETPVFNGFNWEIKRKNELVYRKPISFFSFEFPACNKCNENYGKDLEDEVKPIMEKLLELKTLNCSELSRLLDWFDKVRVGLYLAFHTRNKTIASLKSISFIDNSIQSKDRMLLVYRTVNKTKRLATFFIDNAAFLIHPSCFTLVIDDFYFLNISADFLISKQLGFPFLDEAGLHSGTQSIDNNMLIYADIVFQPCLEIYQPIFKNSLKSQNSNYYYDNEYVKNNSKNYEEGIGKFFMRKGEYITTLENDEIITMEDNKIEDLQRYIMLQTLSMQNYVLKTNGFIPKLKFKNEHGKNLSEQEVEKVFLEIENYNQQAINLNNSLIKEASYNQDIDENFSGIF